MRNKKYYDKFDIAHSVHTLFLNHFLKHDLLKIVKSCFKDKVSVHVAMCI